MTIKRYHSDTNIENLIPFRLRIPETDTVLFWEQFAYKWRLLYCCNGYRISETHYGSKAVIETHPSICDTDQSCYMIGHFSEAFTICIYIYVYSIRVPGWVLKCLNLITAPGSVSNQPGSVTWLATAGISKIHAVSWRNHIENQTTKGAQNM